MLRERAAWAGATYVDTYTPTVGHDMCQSPGKRYVEPLLPVTAGSAHPNKAGHAALAGIIRSRLG